jgi:catechol 2,3-dioxygenase-like lactoylglutathione lyase family enzyme
MIDRIGHINIRTPLFEETLGFYERLLGLKRGPSRATPGPDNVWLFADNGRPVVHVNLTQEGEKVPEVGSRGRLHHVAFDCRDYDAMVKRLGEMNQPYQRYETALDGLFLIVTTDPNGILVELSFGVDNAIDREIAARPNGPSGFPRVSISS